MTRHSGARAPMLLALSVLVLAVSIADHTYARAAAPSTLTVRITSPLGRTGVVSRVRIVAQIACPQSTALHPVKFFVDGALVGEVKDGPPYAVEWVDENPFEAREIKVVASDEKGETVEDVVHLKGFEVAEVSQVSSVLVEASVQDKTGRFINGLDARAFKLAENDVPQVIDLVTPETMPATYALLIDSSQSMQHRMEFVRDAAARLTRFLRKQDHVMVVPFSRGLGAMTGPTDDLRTVSDAISSIPFGGGTAIVDSIGRVATLLDDVPGRKAVVLVTDGYDENSTGAIDEALDKLRRSGSTLYVIGVGGVAGISLKGEKVLRRLAEETGGRVFFPSREEDLPSVHELVTADVQQRYLVTYTPSNQKIDGSWRRIALAVDGAASIRAKPGYFAPKPPPIRPTLEFTIQDDERRFLTISMDDIVVLENGVEQKLDTFQEAVTPVSVVLALDASGSMKKSEETARAAGRSFVEAMRPEDSLSVLTFADTVTFAHDLTTVRKGSLEAVDNYHTGGGTALYDALSESLQRLRTVEGRRAVVVVTDGRDENNPGTGPGSRRTLEELNDQLKQIDAAIFAIGVGPKVDRELLQRLADESGGEAYFSEDVSVLQKNYERVIENLRRRYVISYSSSDAARDGAWRHVEIHARQTDAKIASRGGYFAPEQ
jgi:Ca-activated chloride channel family protein